MRARKRYKYNNTYYTYYYVGYRIAIYIGNNGKKNSSVFRVRLIIIEKFYAIIKSRGYRHIASMQASFGFIDLHFYRYGGIRVYVLFTLKNRL